MALHVVHPAVAARSEPFQQARLIGRQIDAGDADGVEAELRCECGQFATQVFEVECGGCGHGAGRKYNRGMDLPIAIYSTRQVRELDAHAIEQQGVAGYTLMKRAGEASAAHRDRLRGGQQRR